jgi:hypothetical protein
MYDIYTCRLCHLIQRSRDDFGNEPVVATSAADDVEQHVFIFIIVELPRKHAFPAAMRELSAFSVNGRAYAAAIFDPDLRGSKLHSGEL